MPRSALSQTGWNCCLCANSWAVELTCSLAGPCAGSRLLELCGPPEICSPGRGARCMWDCMSIWCRYRWLTMPPVCWFCLPSGADGELAGYVQNWAICCCLPWPKVGLCCLGLAASPLWVCHSSKGKKEESGCKDCEGLANCHIIMACVNPLLACSRPVSCCCELHTGGSPTCVPFSPPSFPVVPLFQTMVCVFFT